MKCLFACTALLLLFASSAVAQLSVQYPLGGEEITAGEARTILWDASAVGERVCIALWNGANGSWTGIADGVPGSAGRYLWHVPTGLKGSKFRIKIGVQREALMTPTFFSIVPSKSVARHPWQFQQSGDIPMLNPNPATETVNVTWGGGARLVEFLDLLGKEIASTEAGATTTTATFSVANLAPGGYFIRITYPNGTIETRKFIKQ